MSDPTPATILHRHERLLAGMILLAHVILALGFSLGPIFEGPDELDHLRYIQIVAQTRALPNAFKTAGTQLHHAPLYYILAAPVAALAGPVDLEGQPALSNYFYGYAFFVPGNDNKNVFLHPRAEDFPYTGSAAARSVHLLRLISAGLSLGTVLACWAVFRELWPEHPGRRLLGLAVVAFQPQFAYISATINNDNLLYLTCTVTLWLLLRQLRTGPSGASALLLGLALGAALLSKVNALFLALPVGAALLSDRRAWRFAPVTGAAALLAAGWWYVRNQALYGDFTASRALFEAAQTTEQIDPNGLALDWALMRAPFAYQTFWARFGPASVAVADWIYRFFDVLVYLAAVGLIVALVRSIRQRGAWASPLLRRQAGVLAAFSLIWPLLLVYFASRAWSGIQGRYLLPGIAAWGALIALGLDALILPRLRSALSGLAALSLAAVCAVSLFSYFLPSYRPLPPDPQPAYPLPYRFEDAAELVGVSTSMIRARPGDVVDITLTWRALGATDTGLRSYLRSVDSAVVQRDSMPGTGNLLSTDWLPGEMWSERYVMIIPFDAPPQTVYPLAAGLADPQTGRLLAAVLDGQEVVPYVGRIAINGPAAPFAPDYRFGDAIGLAEPALSWGSDSLTVCLRWLSLAVTETDYHVFIHVFSQEGDLLAQHDAEPHQGRYPTSGWSLGEVVEECITLERGTLPDTPHTVKLGLYTWPDGQRLPVIDATETAQPDDQVAVPVPER